jgi:hypothetical protein
MAWTDNVAWDAALEADPNIAIGTGFPEQSRCEGTEVLYRPGELLIAGDAGRRRLAELGVDEPRSLEQAPRDARDRTRAAAARRLGLDLVHLGDRDPLGVLRDARRGRGFDPHDFGIHHVVIASPQRHGGDSPPQQVVESDEIKIPEAGIEEIQDIRIGVLDTGIVAPHPFPQPFPFEVSDVADLDVVTPAPPGPYDVGVGHGTLVAGVIARYAPGATLAIRRVLDNPGGSADELEIAHALEAVEGEGFHFVNASFSGFAVDDATMLAFDAAVQKVLDTGTVIIAAVGNEGLDRPAFMAAFDGVVGVASVAGDDDGQLADYSNRGEYVKLCARGTDVQSTYVTGQAIVSGTSFAAPKATALAARTLAAAAGAADARTVVDQVITDAQNNAPVAGGGGFIGF